MTPEEFAEIKKLFEEGSKDFTITQTAIPFTPAPCPSCGYCPHCGRGRYSTYPYYYPYGTSGGTY